MKQTLKKIMGPPAAVAIPSNYYKDLSYVMLLGCSQPILGAIAIIIVKQVLDGSNQLVALIQAGSMAGLLVSLFYTKFFSSSKPQKDYAIPQIFGWLAIILSGFSNTAMTFAALTFFALAMFHISSPSQGVLYQRIYGAVSRGRIVGRIKQWQLLVAVSVSFALGHVLETSPNSYHPAYVGIGILGLASAFIFMSINSQSDLPSSDHRPPFKSYIKILYQDRRFSLFMLFQFLLGIANISGIAVFQVFINDKEYLALSPEQAALVTGVLPPLAMFFSIRAWGWVFDRVNIIHFRIMTSVVMGVGFLLYPIFGFWGAMLGTLVWGIGRGGGQLAWSIGVLDFAPDGQSSSYLSIHTFLTGVRGVVAPFLGIWILETQLEPAQLFWLVSGLIFLSAILTWKFVPQPEQRT